VIDARGLTKRYGTTLAVDDLSFTAEPGKVTGFLGPNGAGKSTTMRMILGLDAPTSGAVTIDGRPYREHPQPLRAVGALLEAKAVHGGRSARSHLRCIAETNRLPLRRVDEVLELVGLTAVAGKRSKGFSLGMGQRLGIAQALLGDPAVLLLDEPVNGLDPEGIHWIRSLLRRLAADGRTVLVSSHLMDEMAQTADQLVVVGRGRLITAAPTATVIAQASSSHVRVVSPQASRLAEEVRTAGGEVTTEAADTLSVTGLQLAEIGELAAAHGVVLHELSRRDASLEAAFLELTADAGDFRADAS
jgi:ABC-2 type transport system ATP-binding protein